MIRGWDFFQRQKPFRRSLGQTSELGFEQACGSKLKLQVRCRAPRQTDVEVVLDELKIGSFRPEEIWNDFSFEFPETSPGPHRLLFLNADGVEWEELQLVPVEGPGLGVPQEANMPRVSESKMMLPYGQALSFPARLGRRTHFELEGLEAWFPIDPQTEPRLELWIQAEGTKARRVELRGSDSHREPVPGSGRVMLTLLARGKDAAGLVLHRPRLVDVPVEETPAPPPLPSPPQSQPNILVYMIDTLRADRLGCYGHQAPISPAIDALVRDGVLFENFTAQSSWTRPSTASIFTGLTTYHHRTGATKDSLSQEALTLAELLQESGYDTKGFVTNLHVAGFLGFGQGFTSYESVIQKHAWDVTWLSLEWLKKRPTGKPFFLYVHTMDPHDPYTPGDYHHNLFAPEANRKFGQVLDFTKNVREGAERGEPPALPDGALSAMKQLYEAEVAGNDGAFGKLMQGLKEMDLYDNTVVVVVSDHGEEFLEHGGLVHHETLYQEMLRVPLVIKFPKQMWAGHREQALWQHIDLAPTLLFQAGVEVPEEMEGEVYLPDRALAERPAFFSLYSNRGRRRAEGVRVGPWKLVETHRGRENRCTPLVLYNLDSDPEETENLLYRKPGLSIWLWSKLKQRRLSEPKLKRTTASPEDVERTLRALPYL